MKCLYLLTLFFLSTPPTYSQFSTCDIRGTTPTLPCNYCTGSPTITIGANTTYPPSPQTVNVADYSTTARFGRFANNTQIATGSTAGPVTMGKTTPSATPQNFIFGDYASLFLIARYATSAVTVAENAPGGFAAATGSSSGRVTVGISSSSANSQTVEFGICSRYANLGYGTPTCNSEFVDVGQVVRIPSPTPTPTRYYQYCRICEGSDESRFGDNAVGSKIASQPTAGPVLLGRTVPAGAPSNSGSNLVQMRGLYHYFYSASCTANSGAIAVLSCETDLVVTNGPTPSPTATSGYRTGTGRWYPPEVGHYLVVVSIMGCVTASTSSDLEIKSQRTTEGGVTNAIASIAANACTVNNNFQVLSTNAIITFNIVGDGNYIFIQGSNMGGASVYQKLSITRIG